MRLRLIWVGKTKNEHVRALVEEYLKRLRRFARCEVTEVEPSRSRDAREGIADEGRRILSALRTDALTILLDVEGREWSSTALAAEVEKWQLAGTKEVAFVIGGHFGVSTEVMKRAQLRWSLSSLTLTHELARVVMVEQLYRAYTIIHGLPYHKEG
ncbi:MAG: rRNA (pseudouridine1915-N3)-methyltransferase [Blastocatellia bacterium]|jgi:23S rRNA (pseudouridine1915-N3)-methyltransferase|nr:rRNA (pseudouridine1915-N3)-methyltransferase [Blastocatellia bacterium]